MDYLTENQVYELMKATKHNRHAHRDATLILLTFRHGFRATEVCNLLWSKIDFTRAMIGIDRVKQSKRRLHIPKEHPLKGDEVRKLRRLKRENNNSVYVFTSQQGNPLTTRRFQYIIEQTSKKLGWDINPHTLRHSCGYHLANQGMDTRLIQDYLGHASIENTVIYTRINPERFRDFNFKNT